mgnify:CR=1 FL=1
MKEIFNDIKESLEQALSRMMRLGELRQMVEYLKDYLIEDALVIIPALMILGKIIKDTPRIEDWLIPYILLGFGIVFAVGMIGFSFDSVIQGILVSGAAVFSNQLYKQVKNRDEG